MNLKPTCQILDKLLSMMKSLRKKLLIGRLLVPIEGLHHLAAHFELNFHGITGLYVTWSAIVTLETVRLIQYFDDCLNKGYFDNVNALWIAFTFSRVIDVHLVSTCPAGSQNHAVDARHKMQSQIIEDLPEGPEFANGPQIVIR
jgi:hypothetical protein